MTFEDSKRYEQLLEEERVCLDNAHEAIRNKSSVGAREWLEAASAARRLAWSIKFPQRETVDVG